MVASANLILIVLTTLSKLTALAQGNEECEGDECPQKRSRKHINEALHLVDEAEGSPEKMVSEVLQQLNYIYNNDIKPVERTYRFNDMNKNVLSDGEIYAKPMVLFVGPWSTGKSSFINYLLGIEGSINALHTGAQPTTSDFTVVMHGDDFHAIEGTVLVTDSSFSALEKYGQGFLERLQGFKFKNRLLEKMTLIDTPGIIENRKQQERGYPFSDVCQWFINRADLIFVVMDPTKLDVGFEMETIFKYLKGRESQIRIILNKADSVTTHELMRVYGALFWSLAPLMNVVEPPRVYVGSFWVHPFKINTTHDLFLHEELLLLNDLFHVIANRHVNKIAFIRQHAVLVRNHALVVDRFLAVYHKKNSLFTNSLELVQDLITNPNKYHIHQSMATHVNVSLHDLFDPEAYTKFFSINDLHSFEPLGTQCSFFSGCILDKIDAAISGKLPKLMDQAKKGIEVAYTSHQTCLANDNSCKSQNNAQHNTYSKP